MNKTKIDYVDSSWNPVTGCLHGCTYCYARTMANRFGGSIETCANGELHELKEPYYADRIELKDGASRRCPYPYGFDPTFHRYRLNDYKNKKGRNIFVCSMADLFGEWVPDEWITDLFKACEAAPQHRYLFLTKNPERYRQLADNNKLPKNHWYGTTITDPQSRVFMSINYNTFLSIEPILRPLDRINRSGVSHVDLYKAKWIIIGAETGNRKDKVIPERKWIEDIAMECKAQSIPLFMKSSLRDLMGDDFIQQYPWEVQS